MMLMNIQTISGIFLLLFLAFPISIVTMDNETQPSESQGGGEPGQGGSSGSGQRRGGSSGTERQQGGSSGSGTRQGGSSGSGQRRCGSSGSEQHQVGASGSGPRRRGSSRSRTNRDGRRFVLNPDDHHRRQSDLITRRPSAGVQQPVPLTTGPSEQRPRMWHPPLSATLVGRLLPRPIAAPSLTEPRHPAHSAHQAGGGGGFPSRLTVGGTPQPPVPAAQQPAPQSRSNPRPVHGGGGQISPVATNSDSSSDRDDWLLKAMEEGEAESSNPQGSGGQINREEVRVIDLSSSDDEEGQIPMDVNTSRLVPHSSGSGRLQPGPSGPNRTAGPHRGGSAVGTRQGRTRVVPHAQHRRQQSNIIRQRPTAAASSSVPAGGTHRQQQIPVPQPLDKADFRAFIQQMTTGTSSGSGTAHQQTMPAAPSSTLGTHHAAASRQGMPSNVPVAPQPAPQSRSDQRPAKVRRTDAGASSRIPIRIQHIVPPTPTILNLNAETANYRQIVQQHTGLGQSISNAIDLDSPTHANDGIATVSATGSDQHQRQSRPESRQLPVELEVIAPSPLGVRRRISQIRVIVRPQGPTFYEHAVQMQAASQHQQQQPLQQQPPPPQQPPPQPPQQQPIQLPQATAFHTHSGPIQQAPQQLQPHLQTQTLSHGHLVPAGQHHVGLRVVSDFGHASTSTGIGHNWPILDHNYWPMPAHDDSPMLPEEHWPTPADYEMAQPQIQIPEEREIGIDEHSVRYTAADRGKGILHEGEASTAAGQGISPAALNVHYDANPQPEEYHPSDPTSFSHLHPDIHSQMPHTLMPNLSVSDASSAIRPSEGSTQEEIERSIDEGLEKLGTQFRAEEEQSHGQMSGQGSGHGHREQQQQQGGFIGQTSDANVFEQTGNELAQVIQPIQPVEMEAEERSQERVVGGEVGEISTATHHHHSEVPQTPPHAQMPSPPNQTD